MKQRLAPFLALLDARYLPLLFAASPQAYVVYQWLWRGGDRSTEALVFAIAGALGYEFVYVGAIAWAEGRARGPGVWCTALAALVFSIGVALYVHLAQGWWALLHAGFPVVAFAYTMTIHTSLHVDVQASRRPRQLRALVVRLVHEVRALRARLARAEVHERAPSVQLARIDVPPDPIEVHTDVQPSTPMCACGRALAPSDVQRRYKRCRACRSAK